MTDPARPFRVGRLHHVQLAIPAGGEDGCRAFWAGVLGLTEIEKPPVLAARGGCWFRDLPALAAALQEAGHPVTWDPEFPGHDRCYSEDPFGNRLEFLEQRRGDQRRSAWMRATDRT